MKSLAVPLAFFTQTLLAFFSTIPVAYADVNMMEASFRTSFTDAEVKGLKIQRRYDSRSNFSGLFGFGWCSTFDIKIDPRHSQVNECGRVTGFDSMRFVNGTYVQTLKTGLIRTFDADTGRLVALRNGPGPLVRIRLPRDAALGEGLKMRLEFDGLGENVTALILPDGKRLNYTYSSGRDLLEVKNAWGNTYRQHYDPLHNLTTVDYPDSTSERMTYDADKDRLLSFEGRDGCKESYTHRITNSPKLREQLSTARLECNGHLKRDVMFDFNYLLTNGRWFLHRLAITRDGAVQSINFHGGEK